MFGEKLYLEVGGKLFDDYHASRVMPGFSPDAKIKMLSTLKDKIEYIVVASANDIEQNKIRADLNISYETEVIRLTQKFKEVGIENGSIVINQYNKQPNADRFIRKLKNAGVKVFKHYNITGYPFNIDLILSKDGFGKNDLVPTEKPIVLVTAPGPGSGKLSTCLSQIYNETQNGIKSGYAKYETFPIWNLPLHHPLNLAYEAATCDLNDVDMIDQYHLEKYGVLSVNYNRDIEAFPVLKKMFAQLYGETPYYSPTDMGVNKVGFCIEDEKCCAEACKAEIVRRYYQTLVNVKLGKFQDSALEKIISIMNELGIAKEQRLVANAALDKANIAKVDACAMQLKDGTIITGKLSKLMCATSACTINALKYLANIDDKIMVMSPTILDPIIELKVQKLGQNNPRLHTGEVLTILAVSSSVNPLCQLLIDKLGELKGCEFHASYIVSDRDEKTLKKLGLNVTCESCNSVKK